MSRALSWLIALLLVAGCASTSPAAGASDTLPPATGLAVPATVSVAEAAALRDDGAFMLDVREPDEWAAGHIPGATLIPLSELAARTSEVPHDQQIVVVCRSGNRSAQGRDILLDAGFPAVTSLGGGITNWSAAGLPMATGD